MSARLVLFTTNSPYTYNGGEVMFVLPEVRRLARELGTLRIVPQHAEGDRLQLPVGTEVDDGLASASTRERWSRFLRAVAWPGFWAELRRGARRGGWKGAVRVWRWAAQAQVTYRWARKAFPAGAPVLFYTYWRSGATLALVRWAAERGASAVITRVHRYELYEESFDPPFQPWHPALYHSLALTVAISRDGLDYLLRCGVPPQRLALYRLGTEPVPRPAQASNDGVLRVVSCSFVTPVKRVPLIAQALLALARRHPGRRLHWTHFGDGPELAQVRALACAAPPANFECRLAGHVVHGAVMEHYANEPVDLFALLSASEGLPVSLQEAASAGIPVLATDVGGVRELVSSDNGELLGADPEVETVVAALERLLIHSDAPGRAAWGEASRRRWAEGFNAETNHTRFAQHVRTMLDSL